MKINRKNYEAYLLDLLEGRLTAEDQRKVRDFLLLHPEYAKQYQETELLALEKEKVYFPGPNRLKKEFPDPSSQLSESNFDLFSIARMEGDLTIEQETDHESMVKLDEKKAREWWYWKQTKIVAEPVIFSKKDDLKRRKGIQSRVIWLSVISSAAAIALLIILVRSGTIISEPELAIAESAQVSPSVSTEIIIPDSGEISSIKPDVEPALPANEPVMFSIKKNPDRPIRTDIQKDTSDVGEKMDSTRLVQPQHLQSRPLRMENQLNSSAMLISRVEYDQIESLQIPSSSIHMSSLSISQIAELDLRKMFDDYTEENKVSLWSIANAGFKGINKITGADISLIASRDDEGDLSGIRFKSKRFSFTRPIDRSE